MLYLLRSYTKDGIILKVGYAEDYSKRLSQYQAHNPGIEEVGKREGEIEDETLLHVYLHMFGLGVHKDEWYINSPDTIEKFNDSWDTISEYLWDNIDNIAKNASIEKAYSIISRLIVISDKINEKSKAYAKYIRFENEKKIKNFTDTSKLSDISLKIFELFKTSRNFETRMKIVCDAINNNKDIEDELSLFVPDQFINYTKVLGTSVIKANGYKEVDLRRLLVNMRVSSKVDDIILSTFKVGERYSKSDIKEMLRKIYTSLDMTKTPKATDLEEYFELRRCKITNKTDRKRYEGFEIVKVR